MTEVSNQRKRSTRTHSHWRTSKPSEYRPGLPPRHGHHHAWERFIKPSSEPNSSVQRGESSQGLLPPTTYGLTVSIRTSKPSMLGRRACWGLHLRSSEEHDRFLCPCRPLNRVPLLAQAYPAQGLGIPLLGTQYQMREWIPVSSISPYNRNADKWLTPAPPTRPFPHSGPSTRALSGKICPE